MRRNAGEGEGGRSPVSSLAVVASLLCALVRVYQVARAGRPSPCRYWPTCSDYALEALAVHGAVRGSALTVRRLLRCHPWARRSGVDLVPVPASVSRGAR